MKYWAKTSKGKKPLGWWYHKIMCEFGWFVFKKINHNWGSDKYYYHLLKMCDKYKINLYGEKLPPFK